MHAITPHGFPRLTCDIDLLIDTTPENETNVLQALRMDLTARR